MTTFDPHLTEKIKPSILIVDDEIDFANTLSTFLTTKGYHPLIATSGWEAINLLKQTKPNIVILDLKFSDNNGINLLPEIKKYAPNAEIVILTGHATLETAIRALQGGAFGYLRKPFSPDRLFLTLENALLRQQSASSSINLFGKLLFQSTLPAVTFDPDTGTVLNFNPSYHKLVEGSTNPAATSNLFFLLNKQEKELNSYLKNLKTNTTAAITVKITSGNFTRYYQLLSFLTPKNNVPALGIMIDITDQYRSETTARRHFESFMSIWENLATGVAIVDSQFTIQQANPWFARFYQTTPDELKGKKCHQVVHGFSRPCYFHGETCPIVNVLALGTVFRTKHQHLTPDGAIRYIETTVAPLHDKTNTIVAFLTIHTDFTEITLAQKAAEEKTRQLEILTEEMQLQTKEVKQANFELLRLSSAKDEFISTVSHELRTPLTVIAEVLNLLLDPTVGQLPEKQRYLLTAAHRNCARLTSLINDLLDMSKLETSKIHVHPDKFDICLLIEEVKKSLFPTVAQKRLSLEAVIPGEPVIVYADEKHIHRVLVNLVGNAIKFTDEGRVTITLEKKEKEVVVSVCDTGCGIPENEHTNIFDKFYQAHSPTGLRVAGSGLGLAIAKKLLELNNSKIGLESKPGVGSRFFFPLPLPVESEEENNNIETNQ